MNDRTVDMFADAEEWRPVVGYESSHAVSNYGRVRSLDRVIRTSRGSRPCKGRILKPSFTRDGYPRVNLPPKVKTPMVHRLVLEAFVGPMPAGMECRHLDDNRLNNHISNLAWGTRAENCRDKVRNGRTARGAQLNHANAAKTVCKRGHPYDEENTYLDSFGSRHCRECRRVRRAKQKAAA